MDFQTSTGPNADTPYSLREERPVGIPHDGEFLTGSLAAPRSPRAVVIIANDRGCARHVPALRTLAGELRGAGLATLLVDLVPPEEEGARVDALAARLYSARAWLSRTKLASLPTVLLGMGEAAPAALLSAAARPAGVNTVIACGRAPDAAGIALTMIAAPTLLIAQAGQLSDIGPQLRALGQLGGDRDLVVLHEPADPIKHALDIARAALAFLARGSVHAATVAPLAQDRPRAC